MPPIRAEHGLSWRKGNPHSVVSVAGGDGDERVKQPRRNVGVPRRHSPSHSRTPSPNQQVTSASGMAAVHVTAHGHVLGHGSRRSPSSKGGNVGSGSRSGFPDNMGGSREKRRASPDPVRKGYAHAHVSQRNLGSKSPAFGPPLKGPTTRGTGGASWGVSSPTSGMGVSGRGVSSPAAPTSCGRGHSSPTLGWESRGEFDDSAPQQPTPLSICHSASPVSAIPPVFSGGSAGGPHHSEQGAEVREMTPLDRVFLEQPHEGRKDVEDDDLHLCNEIQRHLQSRVQSQLMEATSRNASAGTGGMGGGGISVGGGNSMAAGVGGVGSGGRGSAGGGVSSARARAINFGAGSHPNQTVAVPDSFMEQREMELINGDGECYVVDPGHDDDPEDDPTNSSGFVSIAVPPSRRGGGLQLQAQPGSGYASSPVSMSIGGNDLLDDPDLGSADVPPVSPSSGGGPTQGLVLDVGNSMDFLLDSADSRGGARDARDSQDATRGCPGSRSPLGSALTPDVQMSEAGDGQLREVVSGLDAMDLDDVDRALALLTAQKERIIAKQQQQHAGAAAVVAHAVAQAEAQQHQQAVLVPPQPLTPQPISTNAGSTSSSRAGGSGGGRQRRSTRSRHGGEGSPSAGGRSEAFGVSGGGVRGAPLSSLLRAPRGQGRPPPVPGHLSASTAAMRRSSPGNIASLAELDSYLEHHHRRLVEQVEGGVVADDVEAEIKASRQPRRGTRSHQRFGSGGNTGLGSSSSSSGVPRTVGARVSTGSFFHSTLSDGDVGYHREWTGKSSGRSGLRGGNSLTGIEDHDLDLPQHRPGYKRERGEQCEGGSDDGWGPSLRGFREYGGGTGDRGQAGLLGVSGSTQTHSQISSPPSVMSSDDVSVSSYGHPVMVLPTSPNNVTFAGGRPPPSLARIRLEAVRSPAVRHGRAPRGRGGVEDGGPVFTSPDASKHVQELCSPRSAFTPRSASSVSSLASSPARRR